MLINEFSANYDSYGRSTYLYKENKTDGGKLHMGPPWDYDRTFGLDFPSDTGWVWEITNYYWPFPFWWSRLWTDSRYRMESACRWKSYRQEWMSDANLTAHLDSLVLLIMEAKVRNDYIWDADTSSTFTDEIIQMKSFINNRLYWIDAQFDTVMVALPPFTLSPDTNLCMGEALSTSLDETYHFNWIPGPETNTFAPQESGYFALTVTDSVGCFDTDTIFIDLHQPNATFNLTFLDGNHQIQAMALDTNLPHYEWFLDSAPIGSLAVLPYSFDQNGMYSLTLMVSDSLDCQQSSTLLHWVNTIGIETTGFILYPNPLIDNATMVTDEMYWGHVFQLSDVSGKIIHTFTVTEINTLLDLRNISHGIYFLTDCNIQKSVVVIKE